MWLWHSSSVLCRAEVHLNTVLGSIYCHQVPSISVIWKGNVTACEVVFHQATLPRGAAEASGISGGGRQAAASQTGREDGERAAAMAPAWARDLPAGASARQWGWGPGCPGRDRSPPQLTEPRPPLHSDSKVPPPFAFLFKNLYMKFQDKHSRPESQMCPRGPGGPSLLSRGQIEGGFSHAAPTGVGSRVPVLK